MFKLLIMCLAASGSLDYRVPEPVSLYFYFDSLSSYDLFFIIIAYPSPAEPFTVRVSGSPPDAYVKEFPSKNHGKPQYEARVFAVGCCYFFMRNSHKAVLYVSVKLPNFATEKAWR